MGRYLTGIRVQNFLLGIFFIFELLPSCTSLLCYNCLRLECPGVETKLCDDIRNFVTEELRSWYYVEVALPECPDPEDELSWKIMQTVTSSCNARRIELATCALSRLQILAELDDNVVVVTYGTVMGCAQHKLLERIKQNVQKNSLKCAVVENNVTVKALAINFSYEIETCHVRTEYCTKDFCVAPLQSVVRPFKPQKKDLSFDNGLVIGIIALAVIIFVVLVLASWCRTPMSWASNTYRVSDQQVNIVSDDCRI